MRLRRTAYFDGARYKADLIGGKGGTRTLDPGIMSPVERHDEAGLSTTILRVGEDIAALAPHRPERARLTHSVLHSTAWLTIRYSDGRCAGPAAGRLPPTAGTAPK